MMVISRLRLGRKSIISAAFGSEAHGLIQPTLARKPWPGWWNLWHGNIFKALRRIDHLEADLESEVITGASSEKLRVTLQKFRTYIENNQQWIPNNGELWRAGETISTAFVESAVDHVLYQFSNV
jgi:hypothetical protein